MWHCSEQQGAAHSWSRQAPVRVRAQAALAYDLAAVKFRGRGAATNFDTSAFDAELAQLDEARSALAQVTHAAGIIGHISARSSWHHQLPVSTLYLLGCGCKPGAADTARTGVTLPLHAGRRRLW